MALAMQQAETQQYFTEELTAMKYGTVVRGLTGSGAPALVSHFLAITCSVRRVCRWPFKATYGLPQPTAGPGGSLARARVEEHEVPGRARAKWAPMLEQLYDLRFEVLYYSLANAIGYRHQATVALIDRMRSTVALVEWNRLPGANGVEENVSVEFDSYGDRDPEVMTASCNPEHMGFSEAFQLDFVNMEFLSNKFGLQHAYSTHTGRIKHGSFFQMTPEAAVEEHERRTQRRFEAMIELGLLRPLKIAEQRELSSVVFE